MSRDTLTKQRTRRVDLGDGVAGFVRELSGAQLEILMAAEKGDERLEGVRALSRVCCFCACDEDGDRLFKDGDLDRVREDVPFSRVKALAEAALDLSGLGDNSGND